MTYWQIVGPDGQPRTRAQTELQAWILAIGLEGAQFLAEWLFHMVWRAKQHGYRAIQRVETQEAHGT